MKTRRRGTGIGLAILSGFVLLFCQNPAWAGEQPEFRAELTERTGDSERACGNADFQVSETGETVRYIVRIENVANITMAHLHLGKAGQIGSPVVWLYPEKAPPRVISGSFSGVLSEGVFSAKDLVGPMRGHPLDVLIRRMEEGGIYVNVHTLEHPESAVAGVVQSR